MHTYDREIKRFGPAGVQHPVILLVDNDDGALGKGRPFQALKEITKKENDAVQYIDEKKY